MELAENRHNQQLANSEEGRTEVTMKTGNTILSMKKYWRKLLLYKFFYSITEMIRGDKDAKAYL